MPILLKPDQKKLIKKQSGQIIVIALRDTCVFPKTEITLTFGRSQSVKAIKEAFRREKQVLLVCQKKAGVENPRQKDLHSIGTICRLYNVLHSDDSVYVIAKGIKRAKLNKIVQEKPFLVGQAKILPLFQSTAEDISVLSSLLLDQLKKALTLGKGIDPQFFGQISDKDPEELVNKIILFLDIAAANQQTLLEMDDLKKRMEKTADYLAQEIKILELDRNISSKAQDKFDRSMREAVLKQRRSLIDKELGKIGSKESSDPEIEKLKKQIKKAKMPAKIAKKANEELNRLVKMSPMNPASEYLRSYLDWLVSVPWQKKSANNISLKKAQKILDEDHYGLSKIKERILEYLAVMHLRQKAKKKEAHNPTILCFIGPPGVGKTSVGRSVARALGRKFIRISLGGMRDEAEIRGHRRTYVGALPGRIIQSMKDAGTVNPVFMLDEIDKMGSDFRGDPSAALLEALDPEQNKEFSDHYLNVPYDLSNVFFIATGNVLDTIPPALRDRLEIIRFPGYTDEEKYQIGKKYLWPKQKEAQGLLETKLSLTTAAFYKIIHRYTSEAGVRQLEQQLAKIGRKTARKVSEKKKISSRVDIKTVKDLLGPAQYSHTIAEAKDEVARSTGLAWTSAGGEILFIEVALMPGRGKVMLTGHLGDVMKESCQAAISYVRSHWRKFGLEKDFTKKLDIHVHVPEGAVPKDGPSAGVAIGTAVLSALTKRKVHHNVGMTGEITLRGKVLEIGGVKEKVLAAHRAGLKKIILPQPNKKDLEDIPQKIRRQLEFVFVKNLEEALEVALRKK